MKKTIDIEIPGSTWGATVSYYFGSNDTDDQDDITVERIFDNDGKDIHDDMPEEVFHLLQDDVLAILAGMHDEGEL